MELETGGKKKEGSRAKMEQEEGAVWNGTPETPQHPGGFGQEGQPAPRASGYSLWPSSASPKSPQPQTCKSLSAQVY